MKFAVSFSGGKDSMLALHEMVEAGHEPVALLVMYRGEARRSWVHGIDPKLLAAIGEALEIPLICCGAKSETYDEDMERGLRQAQELGAQACVFGDIDTPGHRGWDEARCAAVGMDAILPLWKRERVDAVRKTLDLGYRCLIKCVRNDILPVSWLGQPLSHTHVEQMLAQGIDACGENGEYHTVVVDGPLFSRAVSVENHGLVILDQITAADLSLGPAVFGGDSYPSSFQPKSLW